MYNVPKLVYVTLCIVIALVVITFCVQAIITGNTDQLVSNAVLAATSILGLIIRTSDDDHDDDNNQQSNHQNKVE